MEEFKRKQEETLTWAIAEIKMLLRRLLFVFAHNFIEQGKVTPEEIEMVVERAGINLYNWAKTDPNTFSEVLYEFYSIIRIGKTLFADMEEHLEYYEKEYIGKIAEIIKKLKEVGLYKGTVGVYVTEDFRHLLEIGFASRLNGSEKLINELINDFVECLKDKANKITSTSNPNKVGR